MTRHALRPHSCARPLPVNARPVPEPDVVRGALGQPADHASPPQRIGPYIIFDLVTTGHRDPADDPTLRRHVTYMLAAPHLAAADRALVMAAGLAPTEAAPLTAATLDRDTLTVMAGLT